jgi:hypothetical protein
MQHFQAVGRAAMTRKWLNVEAALAKLDVSPTFVLDLRDKAAMITIYNGSYVELTDARKQLCFLVQETCSWMSSNFHCQVSSTSISQPPAQNCFDKELLRHRASARRGCS